MSKDLSEEKAKLQKTITCENKPRTRKGIYENGNIPSNL
jgi:hypothetical protein